MNKALPGFITEVIRDKSESNHPDDVRNKGDWQNQQEQSDITNDRVMESGISSDAMKRSFWAK